MNHPSRCIRAGRRPCRIRAGLALLRPCLSALALLLVLLGAAGCADEPAAISVGADHAVRPSGAGEAVITEIYYDPSPLVDTEGEWIEVYNPGGGPILNLRGCVLSDLGTDSHTIAWDVLVYPNGYTTLAVSANPGFTPGYIYSSFTLGNTGDEVILSCGGSQIDNVTFTIPPFPAVTQASMALKPGILDAVSNDTATNWCAVVNAGYLDSSGTPAKGTPGGANVC